MTKKDTEKMPQPEGKSENKLFSLANLLSPTVKAALIGALAALAVNWWIVPAQQRQLKLNDHKYDVLVEVAVINADYYQGIWNVFFATVSSEDVDARRDYRAEVQRVSSTAEGMKIKLRVLFKDTAIADEWQQITQIYHDAYYPLGRGEKLTEAALNERLAPVARLLDSVVIKMRTELGMAE